MAYYQFEDLRPKKEVKLNLEPDYSYIPWFLGIVAIFVITGVILIL